MATALRAYETDWPVEVAPKRRAQRFDELCPAGHPSPVRDLFEGLGLRLEQGSIREEPTDFRDRPERRDPIACLTVYAMSAAVMVFFFPLGFALMIFNILGGENLRTTSHVLALTGFGMTLVAAGFAAVMPSGF
ncbi:MAG: hypothetical protein AAGK37_00495 [Pseudomonadota bacterium]